MENVTQFPSTSKPEQQPAAPIQLGLADLAAVVRLIDTVSRRGAFEGAELSDVGTLRNKFVAFINANAPKQEEGTAPAAETPAPAKE